MNTNLSSALISTITWKLHATSNRSESYLIFEDRVTKADGTAYANVDVITLTNNGIMHLFNRISYYLTTCPTRKLRQFLIPARQLLCWNAKISRGLNQLWYKDTATIAVFSFNTGFTIRHCYLISSPTVRGMFSFRIPLKHIFVFLWSLRQYCLWLKTHPVRKTDNGAIFRDAVADVEKVTLDKISWFVPHVIPADAEKISIYKTIDSKVKLPVACRTRQCDMFSVLESTSFT